MYCEKCMEMMRNCAMGEGTECGHEVTSQGLKLCKKCSVAQKRCQSCGAELKAKSDFPANT